MTVFEDPRKKVRTAAKVSAGAAIFYGVGGGLGMTPIKLESFAHPFLAVLEKLIMIAAVTAIISFVMLVHYLRQP